MPGRQARGFPNHVEITVSDPERSVAFYDRLLTHLGFVRSTEYAGEVPNGTRADGGATFSLGLHRARRAMPHDRYAPGYCAVFFADPDGLELEVVFEPRLAQNPG